MKIFLVKDYLQKLYIYSNVFCVHMIEEPLHINSCNAIFDNPPSPPLTHTTLSDYKESKGTSRAVIRLISSLNTYYADTGICTSCLQKIHHPEKSSS
jgi:hypothetical protein